MREKFICPWQSKKPMERKRCVECALEEDCPHPGTDTGGLIPEAQPEQGHEV